MQDDVYVLVQDGWSTGKVLRELEVKKGEKLRETPDLVIGKTKYKAELIYQIHGSAFAGRNVDFIYTELPKAPQSS